MRIDEAIKFAEHAQTMTDIPEVKEFYAMAEKALRTQNQVNWISVKDRLPEKGKSVLVYWDDGFDIGEYVGGEVGYDIYWMPLPEPPERDDE